MKLKYLPLIILMCPQRNLCEIGSYSIFLCYIDIRNQLLPLHLVCIYHISIVIYHLLLQVHPLNLQQSWHTQLIHHQRQLTLDLQPYYSQMFQNRYQTQNFVQFRIHSSDMSYLVALNIRYQQNEKRRVVYHFFSFQQQIFQFIMIQTNNESKCSNKEKVICLALYLMVLTTPASSFHNVIIYLHQKYSHNGYGQSYLTASSLTLIVGFFFSPFIIKKIKLRLKTIMRICSILSIFYTLVPALFTIFQNNISSPSKPPPTTFRYLSQIVANIVNSLSFSIYLVLEGMILSYLCAGRQQSLKSKYFSLYNGILMIRNICAPIFTYFTLGIANQTIYYFVGTFITLFSVLVIEFIGIQQNLKVEDITENYDPAQNKQMKTCLKQYYEGFVSMKKFIPLGMLYGLVMGFVAGSFSHLLPKNLSSGEKDNKISLALLSYGIGCIIGSYLFGFIFPKLKNKKTWKIICMFFIFAFLVEIYCLQNSHQFMFVPIIIGFLFGIALIMVNCFMLLTVTLYFEAKAQCFALVKQTRLIFYITYQWLVKSISSKYNMDKSMTIECILLILLSLLSFYKAIQFYSQKIKFQPQIFVDEKQLNNKTQITSIQIKNIKKNSQ